MFKDLVKITLKDDISFKTNDFYTLIFTYSIKSVGNYLFTAVDGGYLERSYFSIYFCQLHINQVYTRSTKCSLQFKSHVIKLRHLPRWMLQKLQIYCKVIDCTNNVSLYSSGKRSNKNAFGRKFLHPVIGIAE